MPEHIVASSNRSRGGQRSRGSHRRRQPSQGDDSWPGSGATGSVGAPDNAGNDNNNNTHTSSINSAITPHENQNQNNPGINVHAGSSHGNRGRSHPNRSYQGGDRGVHHNRINHNNYNERSSQMPPRPRMSPDVLDWRNRQSTTTSVDSGVRTSASDQTISPDSGHAPHVQAPVPRPTHITSRVIRPSNTQRGPGNGAVINDGGRNGGGGHRDNRFSNLPPRFQKLQLDQYQHHRNDSPNLIEHRSNHRGPREPVENHRGPREPVENHRGPREPIENHRGPRELGDNHRGPREPMENHRGPIHTQQPPVINSILPAAPHYQQNPKPPLKQHRHPPSMPMPAQVSPQQQRQHYQYQPQHQHQHQQQSHSHQDQYHSRVKVNQNHHAQNQRSIRPNSRGSGINRPRNFNRYPDSGPSGGRTTGSTHHGRRNDQRDRIHQNVPQRREDDNKDQKKGSVKDDFDETDATSVQHNNDSSSANADVSDFCDSKTSWVDIEMEAREPNKSGE